MYESLQQLDSIRINFAESNLLNFVLAFIMFGVALGMQASQFKKLALSPKPVVVGIFSQFVALPFVTFLLVVIFNLVLEPIEDHRHAVSVFLGADIVPDEGCGICAFAP